MGAYRNPVSGCFSLQYSGMDETRQSPPSAPIHSQLLKMVASQALLARPRSTSTSLQPSRLLRLGAIAVTIA